MTLKFNPSLAKEWQSLHSSHEKYEHASLIIKLFSVTLTVVVMVLLLPKVIAVCLLALLWLQEGIWKTFQSRTSSRIEKIEQAIEKSQSNESDETPFQHYCQWADNRPSSATLIISYIKSALRPTVMYPYLPLMILAIFY